MKLRKESLVLITLSVLVLIPLEDACATLIATSNEYILDYPADHWALLNGDILRIVDGGELGYLYSEDSTVIIEGGYLYEGLISNTEVTILGGTVDDLVGGGDVTVSGGDIGELGIDGTVDVTGGVIGSVDIGGAGSGCISGGEIRYASSQGVNSMLRIEGGDIGSAICIDSGEVHIFDNAFDNGVAQLWGKLFVYAEQFVLDGVPVANGRWFQEGSSSHILEYYLSDGSGVVANIDLQAYGELVLVPEPGTVFVLGLGGLVLIRRRRVLR